MTEFRASVSASVSSSGPPASSPMSKPPRKRRRPAVVCAECRRRKIACDRKTPCGQCALHNVECVYVTGAVPPPYGRPVKAPTSPVLQPGSGPDWPDTDAADVKPSAESLDAVSFGEEASGEPERYAASMTDQPSRFGGRLAKTRLFGRTHWMHSMDQYTDIHALTIQGPQAAVPTLHKSLQISKRYARAIKDDYRTRIAAVKAGDPGWFKRPPRAVCDHLVALYFNAFECVFRVLHIPTFEEECRLYWEGGADADAVPDVFAVKLILVLALGSRFYDGYASLRDDLSFAVARAVKHLEVAACTPLDKRDLSMDMLQVYCLVIIARQTTAFDRGDDLVWFSTGSLQHMALGMGLHRDPSHFRSLSFFECEMRRRLWATVLELLVQSALDQGMPPLISIDDYDCLPPTNLDDIEIKGSPSENASSSEDGTTQASSNPYDGRIKDRRSSSSTTQGRPDTEFTQSSMQRLLLRSFPPRLKIARVMNSLKEVLPYGRVLQLSGELLEARRYTATTLRMARLMMESVTMDPREKDSFLRLRVLFYEVLTGRFHHSLHSPFARKSSGNTYYFSRRARIDTAVRLLCMSLSPAMGSRRLNSSRPPQDDDSRPRRPQPQQQGAGKAVDDPCLQLFIVGRGLVKCTFIDVHATVVIELILQLQEDFIPGADLSVTQRELYGTAQACQTLLEDRILAGETSVKGLIFFAGGMAQLEALMSGRPVRRDIADAMDRAAGQGIELLQDLASSRKVTLPDDAVDAPVDIPVAAPVVAPIDTSVASSVPASVATSVTASADAPMPHMPPMALPQEHMLNLIVAPTHNIVGPALYGEIDAGNVDIDAIGHFPSTDLSVTGSAGSWNGEYMVDPNWFYPYNDCVGASF
ncbi:c6 zinc finger domain containing protein [Grosmannia clavigera kw1407]|uniref:C6 zinc finger domain containing protein n=1 Tax=Grosmannia clavigera (strain kw1407 / UAMH 11150) TaxID=655863 RepID=F0XCK1_GROCL|nr:c6 zinc finger domain containing protein [Grosmannia clavigera kw1407]EFX04036.1 c6 zinc finger domain containing protein [Grosmannia clavigera kw1407]